MELSEKLQSFIRKQKWIFAKTYADTWPHEYIVKEQVDSELFHELANRIDNLTYWHMENIINHCEEKDTYRYRKKIGLIPEEKGVCR